MLLGCVLCLPLRCSLEYLLVLSWMEGIKGGTVVVCGRGRVVKDVEGSYCPIDHSSSCLALLGVLARRPDSRLMS